MSWRIGLAACLATMTLGISPAHACMPPLLDPRLSGEGDDAYKVRTEALRRERAAAWLKERQAMALRSAETIFVAHDWTPPIPSGARRNRPHRITIIQFPPLYFRPMAWFRGVPRTGLLRVSTSYTSCGPMSVGDTGNSADRFYVFYAHNGPLSEKTLIDAIAVNRINDPALMEFVAKYRGKSPPDPMLPH